MPCVSTSKGQLGNVRTEKAGSIYSINLAVYLIKRRAWGEEIGCKAMRP